MWFKSALLICMVACMLAEKDVTRKSETELLGRKSLADAPRSKVIPVEEFVTSHKVPETIARPSDDDEDVIDVERRAVFKDAKHTKKVIPKFENFEKKAGGLEPIRRLDPIDEDDDDRGTAKRQVQVELENFSDAGVLQEDGIRRTDQHKSRAERQKESVIPGVYVSAEYSTTMMPVLTTPREARGFDFVPVNIIREDGKDAYTSFADRNFGDLSDVSLVPAGTNSRIQVKKGPNGKDYEYEYVYYYYDEEDESKPGTAGSAVTNSYDLPSRTTAQRRGGPQGTRGKYNSGERSSTVEPASNEVIPNRNGNRGRQLAEAEDVSEERLPTNTRFPPRSRSNHNTGTTESSRTRGNRPRPGLDLVDSSSFRTHQDGPEFPQVLPKGPVRFLGVTPNEDNERAEEKPASRARGRPQRIQEPAPVEEITDDAPAPTTRRRPTSTAATEIDVELNRSQSTRSGEEVDDEEDTSTLSEKSKETASSLESRQDSEEIDSSSPFSSSTATITTENPTTEYPSAMDKVALDLYAFLQQGQNNLVDATSSEATDIMDATTMSDDEATTDLITTTELSPTTVTTEPTTTTTAATTTTTEPATTTTTTTEPPTTTTQAPAGRGKFRRPGIGGPTVNRNRFKSNGGGSTTTEAPAETTQRTRARFGSNGSNGSGGYKRPRPGHKPVEEDAVQKESASSANAEKPSTPRGRFRSSAGTRSTGSSTTTSAPPSNGGSTSSPSGIPRPTFNKLNINRRRGRPTTATPNTSEESQEAAHSESGQSAKETAQETVTAAPKSNVRTRLPGTAIRPGGIRPGPRVNLRQKPGQASTTTTAAPETAEPSSVEEPAGEGTEEETHEAPAETVPPPTRTTTVNPLNKLRNRNRLQVHPKTTTRSPVSLAPRRSPLLPRRKVTEAPIVQTSQEETSEEDVSSETETTEATSAETSTAASTKHEETRGLSGLLAPRRRIAPRRPGQAISRE